MGGVNPNTVDFDPPAFDGGRTLITPGVGSLDRAKRVLEREEPVARPMPADNTRVYSPERDAVTMGNGALANQARISVRLMRENENLQRSNDSLKRELGKQPKVGLQPAARPTSDSKSI